MTNTTTNDYNFEKLSFELLRIRKLLKIFTILHFSYILIVVYLNQYNSEFSVIIPIVNSVFYLVFILFIWFKMPMSRYDKITETILIVLFGVFALWMWVPNQNELKAMIDKKNTTHNTS